MELTNCKRVDLCNGGGTHKFGFYISKEVTDLSIKEHYQNCCIATETLVVYKTLEEVANNSTKNLRKSAWNKLTPLERIAMGMNNEPI